jgi:thymidylate synthase
MQQFEDISFATAASLRDLVCSGQTIEVRGSKVLELLNRITILKQPTQRCLFLPGRGNDPFAAVAETLWMLAGRNDIEWIKEYLPRAPNFSDDGVRWRAAYGPRLRNWSGTDQVRETVKLLRMDRNSRRAVMTLFDPAQDYVDSLDIPCTNWLSWLVRENRLHLIVGIRSNDIWWGFSGINAFEWSVLQQWMAHWVEAEVGDLTFIAPSLHLYERHFEKAEKTISRFRGVTCYQHGLSSPPLTLPIDEIDATLGQVFAIEGALRKAPLKSLPSVNDPFLDACLASLQLRHAFNAGASVSELASLANRTPDCDLKAAAIAWLANQNKELVTALDEGPTKTFTSEYLKASRPGNNDLKELATAIVRLHRRKDLAYGNAWKRRGELRSIIPNIARKIDRLSAYIKNRSELAEETILDTAIDLLVYLVKYRLFLLDEDQTPSTLFMIPASLPLPYSDGPDAFEVAVEQILEYAPADNAIEEVISACVCKFDDLDAQTFEANRRIEIRATVDALIRHAVELVFAVRATHPYEVALLIAQEQQRACDD